MIIENKILQLYNFSCIKRYNAITYFIFTCVVFMWLYTDFIYFALKSTENLSERSFWPKEHPLLILQGLVSILALLCHVKLLFCLQIHPNLGPIHTSLANACVDILRLLALFIWVLLAFTIAISGLFSPYTAKDQKQVSNIDR